MNSVGAETFALRMTVEPKDVQMSSSCDQRMGLSSFYAGGDMDVLGHVRVALERVKRGRHAKAIVVVGQRGVGITAMLNEMSRTAASLGYETAMVAASERLAFRDLFGRALHQVLLRLESGEPAASEVARALRVMRSFLGPGAKTYEGADIPSSEGVEPGCADSGNLVLDFRDVVLAVGEAARAVNRPVALLVDDLQCLEHDEVEALIYALHAVAQHSLPVFFVGAGSPEVVGRTGAAKSYAERLFDFIPFNA